jgi:hypothetical protein
MRTSEATHHFHVGDRVWVKRANPGATRARPLTSVASAVSSSRFMYVYQSIIQNEE